MTTARLIRDLEGRVIPGARVRRELVWTGNIDGSGALPAWLTCPNGTLTFNSLSSACGGIKVATAASINASAQLAGPSVNPNLYDEVKLTLEGLTLDDNNGQTKTQFGFGFYSASLGIACIQTTAAPTDRMQFQTMGSGGTVYDTRYQLVGSNGNKAHNLSLLVRPPKKKVWLMADDQVINGWNFPVFNGGAITPLVSLITKEAVAHSFSLLQLKLELSADRVTAN